MAKGLKKAVLEGLDKAPRIHPTHLQNITREKLKMMLPKNTNIKIT